MQNNTITSWLSNITTEAAKSAATTSTRIVTKSSILTTVFPTISNKSNDVFNISITPLMTTLSTRMFQETTSGIPTVSTNRTIRKLLKNGTANSSLLFNNGTNVTQNYGEDTMEVSLTGKIPINVKLTIFSIILVLSLSGNILLLFSILFNRRLRRLRVNHLIVHLTLSDILRVLFTVPFNLKTLQENRQFYLFDEWVCKTQYPIATYAAVCSPLTLVCIAVERYLAISSKCMRYEKQIVIGMILTTQAVSIGSVVPYIMTLTYFNGGPGDVWCYEEWYGTEYQKAYTVYLAVIQYGLPVILITLFYTLAWHQIMKRNKRMIKVSEEFERKIAGESADSTQNKQRCDTDYTRPPDYKDAVSKEEEKNNNVYKSSLRRKGSVIGSTVKQIRSVRVIRKPRFISKTAYTRHRQTVRTMKMFTLVVLVFVVFALPNQILWLMQDFKEGFQATSIVIEIFVFLTYSNAVVNCWIYGFVNKHFRKAYKEMMIRLLPCLKQCCHFVHLEYHSTYSNYTKSRGLSVVSMTPVADTTQETSAEDEERQRAFAEMFNDHLNNFEKFEHLYQNKEEKTADQEEQPESEQLLTSRPKLKKRLSSLVNIFAPSVPRKTSQVDMQPMNKPTTQGSQTFFFDKRRVSNAEIEMFRRQITAKTKSVCNLDFIDIDDMIPREDLKIKKRMVRSTSDLREKTKSNTSLASIGVKKRTFWDILSPKIIRKKYSSRLSVRGIEHSPALNGHEDEDEEQMVMASQVNVQTSNCVQVVPIGNLLNHKDNTCRVIKTVDILNSKSQSPAPSNYSRQPAPSYDHRLSLAMLKNESSEKGQTSTEIQYLDNDRESRDSHV